ncbi:MAG: hypothetical protein WC509_05830 [Candidatus Izemoplasmatales bacterium]
MVCEICGAFFAYRATFFSLVRPPRFCPRCLRKYAAGKRECAVPIPGGLARFLWAIDAENVDHHLSVLLYDGVAPLLEAVGDAARGNAVVVLLECAETATFADWFPAVAAFRDVRFVSLFLVDPERFEDAFSNLEESESISSRPVYKHHNSMLE